MSRYSLGRALLALLRRDLVLAFRRRSELLNALLFFVLVVTLFPMGMEVDAGRLAKIAPGVIWVAALLANVLSLEAMFRSDFEDGTLEQMALSPHPLGLLVLVKVFGHWLVTGLPLIVVSPLLAVFLGLPDDAMPVLLTTLALGTPVLSLVGSIGVALTVGLRRGGVILPLLVMPLYVPVLVFASNAVDLAAGGVVVSAQLLILGALLLLALTLAPVATAAALRVSLS